jgi:glycosyltransferase involved in cell wall biosynthesis
MELGIINRVRIIDPVPHYELAKYYNMMDVLVSVSISLPRWKEQFGLVVAQAMSSGVPVIGSNSGETPNLIGKAGMIFPEGDSVALSNLLQRLQGDKALRSKLGQLGAQRIRDHYTNRKIADQTYKVWRNLYYGS